MNTIKKSEGIPLLNFEGGPRNPLLNFEGGSWGPTMPIFFQFEFNVKVCVQ